MRFGFVVNENPEQKQIEELSTQWRSANNVFFGGDCDRGSIPARAYFSVIRFTRKKTGSLPTVRAYAKKAETTNGNALKGRH